MAFEGTSFIDQDCTRPDYDYIHSINTQFAPIQIHFNPSLDEILSISFHKRLIMHSVWDTKKIFKKIQNCLQQHHSKCASTSLIGEAKQGWDWLVLGWVLLV